MTLPNIKTNKEFIGIDVASEKYGVCYLDNNTEVFENNAKGHAILLKKIPIDVGIVLAIMPSEGYEKELICTLKDSGIDMALCSYVRVNDCSKVLGFNQKIDSYVIRHYEIAMLIKGIISISQVKFINTKNIEHWLNLRIQVIQILTTEKQKITRAKK